MIENPKSIYKSMHKKGMTLIEVLIALFVFAVGILAVVRVITTNITVIDTMKVRIQAQSLAKEGMDLVFSIRDTNLERGLNRQCAYLKPDAIAALTRHTLYPGDICAASFVDKFFFRVAQGLSQRLFASTTTTGTDFSGTFALNQLLLYTGGTYT